MSEQPGQTEGQQPTSTTTTSPEASPSAASSVKMMPQTEVNELVGRIKREAYEKGLSEAQKSADSSSKTLTPEEIDSIVQKRLEAERQKRDAEEKVRHEQAQKAQIEAEAQKKYQSLQKKVVEAAKNHEDYDQVVGSINWTETPQITNLLVDADEFENAGDVLYEIARDDNKLSKLLSLPRSVARNQLAKLSQSLKTNQNADSVAPNVNEPLRQTKPSNLGLGNGDIHSKSVREFRIALAKGEL